MLTLLKGMYKRYVQEVFTRGHYKCMGHLIENQVLIEVHSQQSIDNMNHRYHFLTKILETYQLLKK